jgi:hypothetical protein
MTLAQLQTLCEAAIPPDPAAGQRRRGFRAAAFATQFLGQPDLRELAPEVFDLLLAVPPRLHPHLSRGLLRASFFIELVQLPGCETTTYQVRWRGRLIDGDPRFASVKECLQVCRRLASGLLEFATTEDGLEVLSLFAQRPKVEHEIPVDYLSRAEPIHKAINVGVLTGDLPRRVARLRATLLDPALNPGYLAFDRAYEKVATKTYKTDRVQTGAHQTNREKRWEAHPDSVHFALRKTCLEIELFLMNQLCHFEGFPPALTTVLAERDLLLPIETPFRCPVTLDPLSYNEFAAEIAQAQHGRSTFQVGHLNPLKFTGNVFAGGHAPDNISWISANGNRIQGHLSLDATRSMLRRIWNNYVARKLWPLE